MSINLVTYANQTVTPTNDAIIYERAIDQNGIFYGCNVTVTSNTVNITGGYGIVCGREFVINSESLTVTLAPSGTLQGRLYVRLDLADADAPIQLLTVTGNTLPALTQDDDVNYTNGVWEMELATFTVGVSALSDVVETFETIYGLKNKVKNIESVISGLNVVTLSSQVANTNVITHAGGGALATKLPNGQYVVFFSIVFKTSQQRSANMGAFRFVSEDGYILSASYPYWFPGSINGAMSNTFANEPTQHWFQNPALWPANGEFRVQGVGIFDKTDELA